MPEDKSNKNLEGRIAQLEADKAWSDRFRLIDKLVDVSEKRWAAAIARLKESTRSAEEKFKATLGWSNQALSAEVIATTLNLVTWGTGKALGKYGKTKCEELAEFICEPIMVVAGDAKSIYTSTIKKGAIKSGNMLEHVDSLDTQFKEVSKKVQETLRDLARKKSPIPSDAYRRMQNTPYCNAPERIPTKEDLARDLELLWYCQYILTLPYKAKPSISQRLVGLHIYTVSPGAAIENRMVELLGLKGRHYYRRQYARKIKAFSDWDSPGSYFTSDGELDQMREICHRFRPLARCRIGEKLPSGYTDVFQKTGKSKSS